MNLPQRYIIETQGYNTRIASDLVDTEGHGLYFHAIAITEESYTREANTFQFAEWAYPVITQALIDLGFIVFSGVTYIDAYIKLTDGDETPLTSGETIEEFWTGLQDYPDLIEHIGVEDAVWAAFHDEVQKGIDDWLESVDYEADAEELTEELHRVVLDYWLEKGLEFAYVSEARAIEDVLENTGCGIVLGDDDVYRFGAPLRAHMIAEFIGNGVFFVTEKDEQYLEELVLSLSVPTNKPNLGDVIKALMDYESDFDFKIVLCNKGGVVLALPNTPTILD